MQAAGLQFVTAPNGKRSSTHANQAICQAALASVHIPAAQAVLYDPQWRTRYPQYLRLLTETAVTCAEQTLTIATNGLAAAWQQVEFIRDGVARPLAEAMHTRQSASIRSVELSGSGPTSIEPWSLPYRGQRLQGEALRVQIAHWEARGIIEPSCARALQRVIDHPEWLDLSDRTLVLLGAGAEAGPLATLAHWRANIIAIDIPDPARWHRIAQIISAGNARLIAPILQSDGNRPPDTEWIQLAGVDMLTHAPEIAAWLQSFQIPLDIATLAYLDGERHLRVALAMDAIFATVSAALPGVTLMSMATPTDIFAVSEATAQAALHNAAAAHPIGPIATPIIRALSGGQLLQPHLRELLTSSNGKHYGIVDCLFLEQGPNYAMAKRIQQWRALIARASGQRVSINVAPPTMTQSVIKHPALRAGYNGAGLFQVEIFAPETTGALMAALWVHDLHNPDCAAHPAYHLDHPLELLTENANHGGLWRSGFLPRTALPLAALVGMWRR
ncbi:MAG: hypothetical protein K6356_01155 [Chloroflexus sp.]